jgi:hypothetical protein
MAATALISRLNSTVSVKDLPILKAQVYNCFALHSGDEAYTCFVLSIFLDPQHVQRSYPVLPTVRLFVSSPSRP